MNGNRLYSLVKSTATRQQERKAEQVKSMIQERKFTGKEKKLSVYLSVAVIHFHLFIRFTVSTPTLPFVVLAWCRRRLSFLGRFSLSTPLILLQVSHCVCVQFLYVTKLLPLVLPLLILPLAPPILILHNHYSSKAGLHSHSRSSIGINSRLQAATCELRFIPTD